jgi:integrase
VAPLAATLAWGRTQLDGAAAQPTDRWTPQLAVCPGSVLGSPQTQGHVFTIEDGRPLDPAYITRLFQVIRRQAEPLPELTFHGLRHSYASLMLAEGTDISIVSKLCGHSSISVTADIYAHMLKGVGQQAAEGVANRIARTLHTQPAVSADAG